MDSRQKLWHRYFVENRHRFTDLEIEAKMDKNKIYIFVQKDNLRHGRDLYRALVEDYKFEQGIEDL